MEDTGTTPNTSTETNFTPTPPLKKKRKAGKVILWIIAILVALGLGGAAGYMYSQNSKAKEIDQAKQEAKDQAEKDAQTTAPTSSNTSNSTTNSASPSAPAKTTTDTTCNADELSLTANASDAAAGTVSYTLVFTNTGKRTCTLEGFPGVSLVNDNGNQIGSPAERATNYTENKLTLTPGQKVKAIASVSQEGNFPAGQCKDGATKLRVYPPNDTGYLSTPTTITAWCPGFEISPVLSM